MRLNVLPLKAYCNCMYRLEKFYRPGFDPKQYWEDRYAKGHAVGKSSEDFRKQGFWPLLKEQLDKNKKYLDAGCGVGGWVIFLKDEGYDVEGVDSAARVVRAISEVDPDLKIKAAPITALPYADGSLDGVLSIGTLEYAEGRVPEALNEVARVLKNGGILFLEVPLANLLRRLIYLPFKKLQRMMKAVQGKQPVFANYVFRRSEMADVLRGAGFEIVKMQPHELPDAGSHYGLYVDWPMLRGKEPYLLNAAGLILKRLFNMLSPWIASTGMVVVARKVN